MTIPKHLWAALAALLAFGILTVTSSTESWAAVGATAALALACTTLYFHYRRRLARAVIEPLTPSRDDRVIPQDLRIQVALRDEGQCTCRGACGHHITRCGATENLQYDHRFPWSQGGSSKDLDNIYLMCKPCNQAKGAKILV